jgi:hypothetical protein
VLFLFHPLLVRSAETPEAVEARYETLLRTLREQLTPLDMPLAEAITQLQNRVDLLRAQPVLPAIDAVLARFGKPVYDEEDNTLEARSRQALSVLVGRGVARQGKKTIFGVLGQLSS